jgi:putative Mn2+ efflux pump MntP
LDKPEIVPDLIRRPATFCHTEWACTGWGKPAIQGGFRRRSPAPLPSFIPVAMSFATALLLAFSLSMDSFAAALGTGAALRRPGLGDAVRVGLCFGGVQLLMPLIGFALGLGFAASVEAIDHWIAFFLLLAVGGKMVWESQSDQADDGDDATEGRAGDGRAGDGRAGDGRAGDGRAGAGCGGDAGPVKHKGRCLYRLLATGVATSVDAAAVGVSLALVEVDIVSLCLLIGAVTFGVACSGVMMGRAAGPLLGRHAELAGGLGLMAIGTKILIEHTVLA